MIASANAGFGQWLWPTMAAMYVVAILPGLIAFIIVNRWYMRGLQEGALKG